MTASEPVRPLVSVVVPLYQEEENVEPLVEAVREALGTASWELVLVDDGSSDGTRARAARAAAADPRVRLIPLARNYGQTAAMQAGFDRARGEVIVSMDGDLQIDPGDIPLLVARLEEGYDRVTGYRLHRQDRLLSRKLPSWIANRLIRGVTGVPIRDTGCSLKAYRREVLERMRLYADMHRFIPALAAATAGAGTPGPAGCPLSGVRSAASRRRLPLGVSVGPEPPARRSRRAARAVGGVRVLRVAQPWGEGVAALPRTALMELPLDGDFARLLPLIAERAGFRVEEVPCPQHPDDARRRLHGPGGYVRRLIDVLGVLFLVRFTEKPLRFFGLIGGVLFVTGAVLLAVLAAQKLEGQDIANRPMLLLAVLLVVLGVHAIALGLIGEIIVHLQVARRPGYWLADDPGRAGPEPGRAGASAPAG